MYAVIKAGGKQQRVEVGDVIEVELMQGGGPGDEVRLQPLLVVDDDGKTHVGKALGRAVVTAALLGEKKGEKVKVFKYRQKTGYARRQGHRQMLTMVEIKDIGLPAGTRAKAPAKAAAQTPTKPPAETESEAPSEDAG
jgi:large subunit ribosomal protein L21